MAKTRRSPIKHPVKQHLRKGRVVHHYERGSGKALRAVMGSASKRGGGGYSVTFMGDKTESFSVQAGSYVAALDSAQERVTGSPTAVKLRRR